MEQIKAIDVVDGIYLQSTIKEATNNGNICLGMLISQGN